MNNGYLTEDLEAMLESLESDESDELAERRPRSWSPPRRPSAGPGPSSYKAPVNNVAPVTQRQVKEQTDALDTKLAKIREEIAAISTGLKAVSADVERQTAIIKKEVDARKKDSAGLRNNVQLSAMLPLLMKPPTVTLTSEPTGKDGETSGLKKGDKVLLESTNSMASILPLLLLSGGSSGSDSSGSSGSGGLGDSSTMLVLALALSGGSK